MSGSVESEKPSRQLTLICGALLVLTLAVYWPSLGHDFVNYDDQDYVTSNPHVQAGLSLTSTVWAFTTGHASNWHPLTWISHMLDCQLYGLNPAGHHATSLLLHAVNVLLLFWVLNEMTAAKWQSAFVAALFAWHPLHVESVAWVSERKDVLSTLFWLLTMAAYGRYKLRGAKGNGYYFLALLCFALGLLCKPMLVTLPFVLLLLDYWPLNRSPEFGARSVDLGKPKRAAQLPWARLVLEKAPFFLLAAASSAVTFLVQRKGGAVSSLNILPFGQRVANAAVSYLRCVSKVFWPANLSVLYPHPGAWPAGLVVLAVVFLVAITTGVWLVRRSKPYLVVGWFWFLGTLVPVIGLVQVGVQSMADRYTYVPAIGLFIMLAWAAPDLLARWPQRDRALGAAGGLALAACLVLTFLQLQFWRNGETLFRHVVRVTTNNYLAYNNLGFYLYNHGKADEAMENYRKSMEINPQYDEAQNNYGHALAGKGRFAEAVPYFEAALRLKPTLVEAHNNLGNALANLDRLDEAIPHYLTALRLKPDDEDAHNNLGIARAMQGRLDEAVQLLGEAVRLKPFDAGAHSNLGNALAAQHKFAEAANEFQTALLLNPNDAQARNNLGNVLSERGMLEEARQNYVVAIKLNPNNPNANYNLGLVLLRQGKADEAKEHFLEALRLQPGYAQAQRQLDALNANQKP